MGLQFLINGLALGCIHALSAVGFALVYNTTRIFHIAHGAVYAAAAYAAWHLVVRANLPPTVGVLGALVVAMALGGLMELLVYAPLNRRQGSPLAALLASLGIYLVVVNALALAYGNSPLTLPGEVQGVRVGAAIVTGMQMYQIAICLLVLPLGAVWLARSALGKAIRAVRDHPELAQVSGINVAMVRLGVFALGSALVAAAALMAAWDSGFDPHVGLSALLTAATALIVGGVGTFRGPILGGLLVGLLQGLVIWKVSTAWSSAAVFLLLIVVLLVRPQGLLGERRRVEELVQ